ncbi:hypothetical protein AN958_03212 [Leucoagaricus sp. SymC.cos]|nr:hypothetical protein AN958_03212 [Leucoagaricus sp. SymC.cos]
MYRFADYVRIPIQLSNLNAHDVDSSLQADIPVLKSLAKKAISRNLSKSNIISELFSSFTHKYQEIIEVEVDFLVANFTPDVARQLDEMLQLLVLGTNPRSFRVLAFTMRRLRGDSTEKTWSALNVGVSPVPPPDFDLEWPPPSSPRSEDTQPMSGPVW